MRVGTTVVLLLFGTAAALAQARTPQRPAKAPDLPPVRVELQDPVPPVEPMQTEIVLPPSECRVRLSADLAQAPSIPPRAGPGACGGEDLVRLEAIHLPDRGKIAVTPPAVLRCGMAEALVDWARNEVPPVAGELGARVTALDNFASYDCRGRNNVAGAKLSEHGTANAFDLRGLKLATGKVVDLTDTGVDRALRERLRSSLCGRFTTVLGPGSDRYHENHIHLDLIARRGGYRMCQWEVREPQVATVPLPRERPKDLAAATVAASAATADVPLPVPRPKDPAVLTTDRGARSADPGPRIERIDGPTSAGKAAAAAAGKPNAATAGKPDAAATPDSRKTTADRARAGTRTVKQRRSERRHGRRARMPWDGWFRFR